MTISKKHTRFLIVLYLSVWLVPVVLWTAFLLLNWQTTSLTFLQVTYAGLASAFGPFATYVLQLASMPNGGDFFSLGTALGFLLPLLVVISISFMTKKQWVRRVSVALYLPLVLGWVWVGIAQVGCCLT